MVVLAAHFLIAIRCFLLLQSTDLWCPHGKREMKYEVLGFTVATSAVYSDKVTQVLIDSLQIQKKPTTDYSFKA